MPGKASARSVCGGLEVPNLPPSLSDARVPQALAQLPRKLQRFKALGWLLVPAGDEANAAMERVFLREGKVLGR